RSSGASSRGRRRPALPSRPATPAGWCCGTTTTTSTRWTATRASGNSRKPPPSGCAGARRSGTPAPGATRSSPSLRCRAWGTARRPTPSCDSSAGSAGSEGVWRTLRPLVDWVSGHWHLPDSSIWEVRGETRHYVFSKVMNWVALDCGIRIATDLSLPADLPAWTAARDAVRAEILERGWNPARGAFIQAYDHPDTLDAAALTIPMMGFLPWDDPRVISTVRAIQRDLTTPDGELVFRYLTPDGLDGEEGAFSICTFWLAEALCR